MSDIEINFTLSAYAKMILHILKHTNSDCHGALVGKIEKEKKIVISDIYPLFHTNPMVPQIDLSLRLIEKDLMSKSVNTSSSNSIGILGFYENLIVNFDKGVSQYSTSMLYMSECIAKKKFIQNPIVLEISHMLNQLNTNKNIIEDSIEYKIYRYINNSMKEEGYLKENELQFNLVKSLLKKNMHNDIYDIDDHLINNKFKFTNELINENIKKLIQ